MDKKSLYHTVLFFVLLNSSVLQGFSIKSQIQEIKKIIKDNPAESVAISAIVLMICILFYIDLGQNTENNADPEPINTENNADQEPIDYNKYFPGYNVKTKTPVKNNEDSLVLDFENLKSRLPNDKKIEEIRTLYNNNKDKGPVEDIQYNFTKEEIVCACIKEFSEKNKDMHDYNWYIERFLAFFGCHIWVCYYSKNENLIDTYLYYCLLDDTATRLPVVQHIINYDYTCIVSNLYNWIEKAIEANNDTLFDFCMKYYESFETLIEKLTNTTVHGTGEYAFPLKSRQRLKNFKYLLYSLPRIEQLLKREKTEKEIEIFYYKLAKRVFYGLHLMNNEKLSIAKDILFLSEKFKKEKLCDLCKGTLNNFLERVCDYSDGEKDLIFWRILYEEMYDNESKELLYQQYFNEFQSDFDPIYENKNNDNDTEKFFKLIRKYRFLVYLEGKNLSKKLQLLPFLPKIIECLVSKKNSENLLKQGVWSGNLFKGCMESIFLCIESLCLHDLHSDEKTMLSGDLNQIIGNHIDDIYQLNCVNIFLKIYYVLFKNDPDFFRFHESISEKNRVYEHNEKYISFLIKKLLQEGNLDFNNPIVLKVHDISFTELFKIYFNKNDVSEFIDNYLKDIISSDEDLMKIQQIIDHFKIKIPLSLGKIKILSENEDSLWKRFLTQNDNNFVYEKMFWGRIFNINIDFLFKKGNEGKIIFEKLTKYYDCFKNLLEKSSTIRLEDLSTKNANGKEIKTILVKEKTCMLLNVLNNYYNEKTSSDFIEFFRNQHCSFKEINLILNGIRIKKCNMSFLSFLFPYVLPHISNFKDKQGCINKLVDLFKQNKYPLDEIFYESIKNNMDRSLYNAAEANKIDVAKAIILSEKQKNLSGYDTRTGFNILHVLILQNNTQGISDLVLFLKNQHKVKLLTKLLETKVASQLNWKTKYCEDKTPVELVKQLINSEDDQSYKDMQDILAKGQKYLNKIK